MKEIMVTGGAGFIGSHLTEKLLREDDDIKGVIIIIDDLSMGKIANLPNDPRITIHEASILDDIGPLFKGVDVVYHLAATTRPQWSIEHPFEVDRVNTGGTIKIMQHCMENEVPKLLFVSTSAIYGEQDKYPSTEEDAPNPMNPYALTKLIGEQYGKLFKLIHGLKANYVRPFNVYGTKQNPNGKWAGAIPVFVDKLSRGERPTIMGTGEQRRDFIYIDDAVDLMVKLTNSDLDGEVFNIGSGTSTSINEIYNMVCKYMGVDIKPIYEPAVFEPFVTLADVSKAKRLLGWEPKISLEEGIKRTIEGTLAK